VENEESDANARKEAFSSIRETYPKPRIKNLLKIYSMTSFPIDLHLELSSLRDFINGQIHSGNPYSFDGKELYEILKRVVIDSELKPFLTAPKDESEVNYYEKYRRLSQEKFDKFIPDFFEYEGEFYDLERIQYVYKEFTRPEDFEKLFLIKLLELKANDYQIGEFLYFQQVDNFYGQKDSIDGFLYQLTANDSNCRLLQELCQVLRNWIGSQSLELLKVSPQETESPNEDESEIEKIDTQEQWEKEIGSLKDKSIKCKWTLEQIKHYFSFLYNEKSENGDPYLTKEQVEKIFENGFRIPEKQIDPLFKLNHSLRYPLKNVKYAIYYFYSKANNKSHDKLAYLLFFGSFIEDFKKYLTSNELYKSFSNNSHKAPARNKIAWDKYRPS
jgi:hypothetical protein